MENYLKGKRVLFMGDSITALNMGERGWPRYFCELLEPEMSVCTAVPGARWRDFDDTGDYDGNPVFLGDAHSPKNVMGNQVEKCKLKKAAGDPDYEHFDVIIMAAGSNDGMPEADDITDAQFFKDGEYIPLENASRKTWGGAMRYVSESLYELYPEAIQIVCTPVQADDKIRSFRSLMEKGRVVKDIAARLSIRYIDTIHCGIYGCYEKWGANGRSLVDGLHPNQNGAKQMGFFIAMAVKAYLG